MCANAGRARFKACASQSELKYLPGLPSAFASEGLVNAIDDMASGDPPRNVVLVGERAA